MSRARTAAIAVAAVLAALVGLLAFFWDYPIEQTRRAMLATPHPCPAGTTEKVERAGEIGWLRSCVRGEIRDGPFVAWKKQYKHAEGVYEKGKLVKVAYFDESGRVLKVEGRE